MKYCNNGIDYLYFTAFIAVVRVFFFLWRCDPTRVMAS